jgi:hypothetical protein
MTARVFTLPARPVAGDDAVFQPGPGRQFVARVLAVTTAGYLVRAEGATELLPFEAALRRLDEPQAAAPQSGDVA